MLLSWFVAGLPIPIGVCFAALKITVFQTAHIYFLLCELDSKYAPISMCTTA